VAAHAVVVQRDEEGEIVWEETAWGDGCDGREFDEGRNWATYVSYTTALCDVILETFFVGYEDLPQGGGNDYDYNDFLVRFDTDFDVRQAGDTSEVDSITLDILPRARGASFEHEFGIELLPEFLCAGEYNLTVFDATDSEVSSDSGSFDGSSDVDIPLFILSDTSDAAAPVTVLGSSRCISPNVDEHVHVLVSDSINTGDAYPEDATNIVDGEACVESLRTAELTITFDDPCEFDIDVLDPTAPHGSGLFFNPYIVPDQTGETIDVGDVRLLTIPDTWLWPLKEVPIWEVYDEVDEDGTG
jgi:hypothetical protein